jgi:hypothetical protein
MKPGKKVNKAKPNVKVEDLSAKQARNVKGGLALNFTKIKFD